MVKGNLTSLNYLSKVIIEFLESFINSILSNFTSVLVTLIHEQYGMPKNIFKLDNITLAIFAIII